MEPNALAYLVLGLWPLIAIGLFQWLPPVRAFLANIFLSYLFLPTAPVQFDLPLLPPLDKETLPALSLCLAVFIAVQQGRLEQVSWIPQSRLLRGLLAVFVLSPLFTVLANTDALFFGRIGLPGLGLRDAISLVLTRIIMIVPMLVALGLLRRRQDLRDMLLGFALFGLIYSAPMLIEVRLSPQLNNWIYGFYQHLFDQSIRFGGYRPVVFLYHGIWVAFFAMSATLATAAIARQSAGPERARAAILMLYLFVVLVLCKSIGALLYALILLPLVLFMPQRIQILLAMIIATAALTYPVIKGAGLLPEQTLVEAFARISAERANSLQFRLNNETLLLERAMERPWLGWGSWGRNQIYDPITGEELIADGRWVIAIGFYGWIGFIAEMGLLAAPIFVMVLRYGTLHAAGLSTLAGATALILSVNILDLLPNATLTPLTWLLSGGLLGHCEYLRHRRQAPDPATPSSPAPKRTQKPLHSVM